MGFFDWFDPGNQTPQQTYDELYDELYNDAPQVEPGIRDAFDTPPDIEIPVDPFADPFR
jgi:hypothetical protein